MDWMTAEEQAQSEPSAEDRAAEFNLATEEMRSKEIAIRSGIPSARLYVMEERPGEWRVFGGALKIMDGAFLLDPKSGPLTNREALRVQRYLTSHRGASERLKRAVKGGYGRLSREVEDNMREEMMLAVEDLREMGVRIESVFGEGI